MLPLLESLTVPWETLPRTLLKEQSTSRLALILCNNTIHRCVDLMWMYSSVAAMASLPHASLYYT